MNYNELFAAKTLIDIITDDSNSIKYMLGMLLSEDYDANYNLCAKLVQKSAHIIQYLPIEYQTYSMYEIAVGYNSAIILTMPDDLIDSRILSKAIMKDPKLIKHIPREIMRLNQHLLIFMIYCNTDYFKFIPKNYLSNDICIIYAKKTGSFANIPAEMLTKKFYLAAVNCKIDLIDKITDVECLIHVCNNINDRETHLEKIISVLLARILH